MHTESQTKQEAIAAAASSVLGSLAETVFLSTTREVIAVVGVDSVRESLLRLRDDERTKYDVLVYMTAVDHMPSAPKPGASQVLPPGAQAQDSFLKEETGNSVGRFELVYELQSLALKARLRLKARLADTGSEEDLPVADSVQDIYLTADWHERECYDLFGILFKGHPDLRRILLPDRWDGHPLRKDYPFDGKRTWKVGSTVVDGVWADDHLGLMGGAGE